MRGEQKRHKQEHTDQRKRSQRASTDVASSGEEDTIPTICSTLPGQRGGVYNSFTKKSSFSLTVVGKYNKTTTFQAHRSNICIFNLPVCFFKDDWFYSNKRHRHFTSLPVNSILVHFFIKLPTGGRAEERRACFSSFQLFLLPLLKTIFAVS